MELENIKDLWQKNAEETPEISLEKQREIRMPLEKIRKNMRIEFWKTFALIFILIACLPVIFTIIGNERFALYFLAFFLSMMFITCFYFYKFYKLYKDLEVMDLSTKESLNDLFWKFKLNEQNYISYYLAFVPALLFEITILVDYIPVYKEMGGSKFIIIAAVVITFILIYFLFKIWFRYYYGKHIQKIVETLKIIQIQEKD